jgi:hypothetical protein
MQPWVAQVGLVVLALAAAAAFFRTTRLGVSASLRGTTMTGKLYVRVDNRTWRRARRVGVRVACAAGDRSVPLVETERIDIEPRSAHVFPIDSPGMTMPHGVAWERIEIVASAANALRAKHVLDITPSAGGRPGDERPYRTPSCTAGEHAFEERRIFGEGVDAPWEVCRRCGYARPLPLTAEEEAVRARFRARLAAEERRREAHERAAQADRPAPRRAPEPERASPAAPDASDMPVAAAFYLLGLPQTATWAQVQAAHRRLVGEWHPDRAGDDPKARRLSEMRTQELNRARDRLRDFLAA